MKILLIGGTDADRAARSDALEAAGHQVSVAVTRRFTNRWLARRIKPFDLIAYDTVEAEQPDEFWTEFREAAGKTPVVILAERDDPHDYRSLGFERVLRHPVAASELVAVTAAT